jgi:hypothetical protein
VKFGVAQYRDEVMNRIRRKAASRRVDAKYAKKGFFDEKRKENHPANMQRLKFSIRFSSEYIRDRLPLGYLQSSKS